MSLITILSFIFNLSFQPAFAGFTQFDEEGYPVDDLLEDDEEEDEAYYEDDDFEDEDDEDELE